MFSELFGIIILQQCIGESQKLQSAVFSTSRLIFRSSTCFLLLSWSLSGRNACQLNNGGCSQLCLPTSENTRTCACTIGYNLRSDRLSCEGRLLSWPLSLCFVDVTFFSSLLSGILVVFGLAACFVMWKVPKENCMMFVWPPSNISRLLLSITGLSSFLMYSFHEGIRGIALDPGDHGETLMPISGTLFAVGVDFHAGTNTALPMTQSCYLPLCSQVYRSTLWIISVCTTKIRHVLLSVHYFFFYVVCCQMHSLILATQSLTRSEGTSAYHM